MTQINQYTRRTKIIATLGPASGSLAKIRQLLELGVDLVRLNLSHGDHDGHRKLVAHVRKAARSLNRHVGIIMDLCGPKIRVGQFAGGSIQLVTGESVIVTSRQVTGEPGLISSQYRQLHKDVKKGDRILLDDGFLELRVQKISDTDVHCEIIGGGRLSDHKGMNLPDTLVSSPSFTAKDKKDTELAIEVEADYLALSFVRSDQDVLVLKRFLQKRGVDIPIISKIEKPEAVENIDAILAVTDAIMVARGDLGIELPAEKVPLVQKDLIVSARVHDRPVIVATQMLDSMIERNSPTRAEVGDVANAALAGADAVMLSGETASGKNPLQAVRTMDRIVKEMEDYQLARGRFGPSDFIDSAQDIDPVRGAVAHAAAVLTSKLHSDALIVPTLSGTTARIVISERPIAPTVGVCTIRAICQRMSLYWGVIPILVKDIEINDWKKLCQQINDQCDLTQPGNRVLVVSGFNDDPDLNMPMLQVVQL